MIFQIDHNSFTPVYIQIKEKLLKMIEEHDDYSRPFFSDNELATMFNVNRLTIRRSMEDLVDRGLIYKVRGVGTFVRKSPKIEGELVYEKGFISQWQLQGKKVNAKVLSVKVTRAKGLITKSLEIPEGEKIYSILRLRFADDLPVILDNIYLPHLSIEETLINELEFRTVTEILKIGVGKIAKTGLIEIEVTKAASRECKHLNVNCGDPLLQRNLSLISEDGEILSFGISLHHPDLFHYRIKVPVKTD